MSPFRTEEEREKWLRYVSCESKIPVTRREAAHYARTMDTRRRKDTHPRGMTLKPYRCQYCGKWHLGHTLSTSERKRREKHARKFYIQKEEQA
jgi:hypothetical protein